MSKRGFTTRRRTLLVIALSAFAALIVAAPLSAAQRTGFTVNPLVSDQPGVAPVTDPHLVNAWGLASSATSPWWVNDNETDLSTLYTGAGTKVALEVAVGGGPTGIVFNATTGFVLANGRPASFIFDSEDGAIRAWNGGTVASVVVPSMGGIYKGLAIANTPNGPRLYAADFHNGRIDVFNGSFTLQQNSGFEDPSLPAGFAPFNVQVLGDRVFVAYAKQDADAEDEIAGQGRGRVDVYDLAGNLLGGITGHGQLNAPWGLAIAPASFGSFAGDLLVGNFGDGQINAFREVSPGMFVHDGELRGSDNKSLSIDGLWALEVSRGGNNGTAGQLFFTAGPDDETHGLFGTIAPN